MNRTRSIPFAARSAGPLAGLRMAAGPLAGLVLAAAGLAAAPTAQAQEAASAAAPGAPAAAAAVSDRGFSYFMGFGFQRVQYREWPSILPVRTQVRATSPLLLTGALYEVDESLLFSMDSENTFAPRSATESWRATGPSFGGVVLTDPVLQRNGFSLNQSHTQLLGHYRVAGAAFASAGVGFRNQSFKRFSFEVGADNAVTLPTDKTIEESTSEVLLHLGLAYDTERVRNAATHFGVRALVGLPVWRQLTNTSVPGTEFNSTRGYDLSLEGRGSVALRPNVHLGGWGKWSLSERGRVVKGSSELPKSRLDTLSLGVELLWKL